MSGKVNPEAGLMPCAECQRVLPKADLHYTMWGRPGCCEQCYEQAMTMPPRLRQAQGEHNGGTKTDPFGITKAKAEANKLKRCQGCSDTMRASEPFHVEQEEHGLEYWHTSCFKLVRDGIADAVSHPSHYADTVPGIECIDVVQHFNFNRGNVIKYVWRAGAKGNEVEDLKKARQYIQFEIERLEGK